MAIAARRRTPTERDSLRRVALRALLAVVLALLPSATWSANPFLILGAGNGGAFGDARVGGDLLYFSLSNQGLWRTDGTKAGTFAVTDQDAAFFPGQLATVGDAAFFVSPPAGPSAKLWRTDGSVDGTEPVTPTIPFPTDLATVGERLFIFSSAAQPIGSELRTIQRNADGTFAPPVLVGRSTVLLDDVVGTSRRAFFFATAPGSTNLWVSDGDTFGDILQPVPSGIHVSFAFGERVGFLVAGGVGIRLWVADGTPGGTQILEEAPFGTQLVAFPTILPVGATADHIYFSRRATDGSTTQLWATDGTPNAGVPLRDPIPTGGNPFLDDPTEVVDVYGTAFFIATGNAQRHDFVLFRTDGTAAGTVEVARVGPVSGNRRPRIVGVLSGILVLAYNASGGQPGELRGLSLDWPSLRSLRATLDRIPSACRGVADPDETLREIRVLLRSAHAAPSAAHRALTAVAERLRNGADAVSDTGRASRLCRGSFTRAARRAARADERVS